MSDVIWHLQRGASPIVATAIHNGDAVREELAPLFALNSSGRLREEDPFTADWTEVAATRVVGLRSRFEVDLNRPRDKAVYRTPEDAWGLHVWKDVLTEEIVERSLAEYDAFYGMLQEVYESLIAEHGTIVVLDLHTYNHRRAGPDGPPADPQANPQVNVGTGTLTDRQRFAPLIERFIRELSEFDFPGGRLDVRENVKFFGGQHARWTHATFPGTACVLAVEFKKFFMDEWTGAPDPELVTSIRTALASTVPGLQEELAQLERLP